MKSIINIIMETILSLQVKKHPAVQFCIAKDLIRRAFIVMFAGIISLQVCGQVDQRIAMADKYFDKGEYYTAAGLYEQFLNPSKKTVSQANFPLNSRRYNQARPGGSVNKFDIYYKQAESYRLSNHWQEAAAGYKECFEKDNTSYADAFYWYAVCQRSLGKYDLAEEYVKLFLSHDLSGKYRHEADKELQTIRFITEQISRPDTVFYKIKKNHTDLSNEKGIFALTSINGNQFVFTSTVTDPVINKEESSNHSRLFIAVLTDGTLKNAEPLNIEGVDVSMNQGAATISVDKKTLYFTQWKKENGINISSIYYSKKEGNAWGKPILVSSVNKNGFSSKQPYCSSDGKTLFFASDMPGGSGGFDIWYAAIQADGTISSPVNAGNINTKGDELAPFYHNTSSNLVFASNGMIGMGGYDLYTSKMKGFVFDYPENMGYPVNSSRDDIYFYAPEKNELLKNAVLGSDRGSECCLETYTVMKTAKKKMVSGIVRDCKTNEPLADAVVVMKDDTEKNLEIKTGPDGRFKFELAGDINQQNFNVSKEEYKEKTERASMESLDNADLMIDLYNNIPICIDKIVKEEKKLVIKAENVVTLYFDFDKSIVRSREIAILDSIYSVLAENKGATIQISGYTDGLGTDEYNNKLSDRRAKACADYLKNKGLESGRISFVSFGECCPVEMELINGRDNPDGRSKNRRALININKME